MTDGYMQGAGAKTSSGCFRQASTQERPNGRPTKLNTTSTPTDPPKRGGPRSQNSFIRRREVRATGSVRLEGACRGSQHTH